MEQLIRITTPRFCAGTVFENNRIVKAAPILKWTIGKSVKFVENYCKEKKYKFEKL